jgi:hypothetical protein
MAMLNEAPRSRGAGIRRSSKQEMMSVMLRSRQVASHNPSLRIIDQASSLPSISRQSARRQQEPLFMQMSCNRTFVEEMPSQAGRSPIRSTPIRGLTRKAVSKLGGGTLFN